MNFVFDTRPSDSAFVELIWQTQIEGGGSFISSATSNIEMVVTKQKGIINFTVRGPETKASPAPIPEDAEIFGIQFKLGTFIPVLPINELVNGAINLPVAACQSFWLDSTSWQFPTFENADTFVNRLVRQGVLAHEPIVTAALKGQVKDLSLRSVQRRFLRATGLSHGMMYQIERAHYAMSLLQSGNSILDTVNQAGYYDQPHLTRSLKLLMGQTPVQIVDSSKNE